MLSVTSRKLDLGDLLDYSGQLYLQNALLFLGVSAIAIVAETVLQMFSWPLALLAGLIAGLGNAALINAIAARIRGQAMSIGGAYTSLSFVTYVRYVVTSILTGIAVGVAFLLLIVPGIYLVVRLAFVQQAVVIDNTGVFEAFSRSSALVRGNWWRVFKCVFVLLFLFGALFGALVFATLPFGTIGTFVTSAVELASAPLVQGVITSLYFNTLATKEGDLYSRVKV